MLKQRLPVSGIRLEIAIDVFHHDHGGIDDNAEVDRAERQQVRVLALQDEDDNGEEQCERNVGTDDDGTSQIAQEYPLNEEDQQTTENEVVQHRVRGHPDQRTAIVVGDDLDARRQASIAVEFIDLGLNARNDVVGMLGPPHHHDGGRYIVIVVPAPDSEPRHITDGNTGDVLDLDWKTVRLTEDNVLDVPDLVPLGDVIGAAAVDQSNTADIDRLLPDRDLAAADVYVRIAECGNELRYRNVVGFELAKIRVDVELLGRAAPGIDLHHAGDGQETTRDNVILQGPQIGEAKVRRANDLVAVDFAHQAGLLNLGDLIARQVYVLLQADRRLREREVEVDPVFEGHPDKRQTV